MEAQLVRTLPEGDGWQYEPKWDGFRGVLENVGDDDRSSNRCAPLLKACLLTCRIERPPPTPAGIGPTIELLKVLLRYEADTHGVAPRLIVSAADVEAIAASDDADVPALKGWRREVFGERALALKHCKLALKLKDGKVIIADA